MPAMIRVDKGSVTGTMATIHAFLRRNHTDVMDPVDTILYGPSTSNQASIRVVCYLQSNNCVSMPKQLARRGVLK